MITRSLLAVGLLLTLSMTGAQAFDRTTTNVASRADTCGKARKAMPDRCVVTVPQTIVPQTVVYGSMSDNGPGYDPQGNPIDRQGNIVAVPEGRAGSQQVREVFVSDPRR